METFIFSEKIRVDNLKLAPPLVPVLDVAIWTRAFARELCTCQLDVKTTKNNYQQLKYDKKKVMHVYVLRIILL